MADEQDRPDDRPAATPGSSEPAPPAPVNPLAAPIGQAPPPAERAPAKKAAKKAPAKKAAAKKAPAKKAPAKKAPAKKAPARAAPAAPTLADMNGSGNLDAAKEVAAQAKSTVAAARNPVSGPPAEALIGPESSRLPLAAAIAAALLAILTVVIVRSRGED